MRRISWWNAFGLLQISSAVAPLPRLAIGKVREALQQQLDRKWDGLVPLVPR